MTKILKTFNRATEQDYAEGMNWYTSAYTFAQNLWPDARTAAGVIAALSPRQHWETNKKSAEKIFQALKNQSHVIPSVAGTYMNVQKAWRIAGGEDPKIVLLSSNPNRYFKVRRFFENIMGNEESVTVDCWTALAFMDNPPSQIVGRLYLDIEQQFQHTAEKLKIAPRELQAICWTVVRNEGEG